MRSSLFNNGSINGRRYISAYADADSTNDLPHNANAVCIDFCAAYVGSRWLSSLDVDPK